MSFRPRMGYGQGMAITLTDDQDDGGYRCILCGTVRGGREVPWR